jgi:hypothetical protein
MKLRSYSYYNQNPMSDDPILSIEVADIPEERVADLIRHIKMFWDEKTVWAVTAQKDAARAVVAAANESMDAVATMDKVIAGNKAHQEAAAADAPKKRGRPPGSPNKPKPDFGEDVPVNVPKKTDPALLVSNDGMGDPDSDDEVHDDEEEEEEEAPPPPPVKKKSQTAPAYNVAMMQPMSKLRDILFYLRDTCGVKDAGQLVAICTAEKNQVPVLSRIQDIKGRVESTLEVFAES